MPVPVLETERLVLRDFRDEDFGPMAGFYTDPVSSFYGGRAAAKTHGVSSRSIPATGRCVVMDRGLSKRNRPASLLV